MFEVGTRWRHRRLDHLTVRIVANRAGRLSLRLVPDLEFDAHVDLINGIVLRHWSTVDLVKDFLPETLPSKWDLIHEDPFASPL